MAHPTHHRRQNPNPRQQFITDLTAEIKQLQADGHEILLGLDANEATEQPNSQIAKLVEACHLTDLVLHLHGHVDNPPPNTYNRGRLKIDHLFGTAATASAVSKSGIDSFGEVFSSTHRGSFVDLDMTKLLGGTPDNLGALLPRTINGKDPRVIIPFKNALYPYVQKHNIVARALQLEPLLDTTLSKEEKTQLLKTMHAIDTDLQRGFEHATTNCARTFKSEWTPKIAKSHKRVHYFQMLSSEFTTGTDLSIQRAALAASINWTPPTIKHKNYAGLRYYLRKAKADKTSSLLNA
jgi:hypothetical protein